MKTHGFLVKYEPTTKTRGRREKEQAQTTKANDENKANAILRILYSIVHVCVFDSLIFDYLIIEHTSRLVDKGTSWASDYHPDSLNGRVFDNVLLEHGGLPYVVPLPVHLNFLRSKSCGWGGVGGP